MEAGGASGGGGIIEGDGESSVACAQRHQHRLRRLQPDESRMACGIHVVMDDSPERFCLVRAHCPNFCLASPRRSTLPDGIPVHAHTHDATKPPPQPLAEKGEGPAACRVRGASVSNAQQTCRVWLGARDSVTRSHAFGLRNRLATPRPSPARAQSSRSRAASPPCLPLLPPPPLPPPHPPCPPPLPAASHDAPHRDSALGLDERGSERASHLPTHQALALTPHHQCP